MSKTRYLVAKKQAKELYDLVPYITPRIAFRYIQQLESLDFMEMDGT